VSTATRIFIGYTRDSNLVTITDNRDGLPPDVTGTTSLETSTPTLTAMQFAFAALAHGCEYDCQVSGR
jgi:hypothetical protein